MRRLFIKILLGYRYFISPHLVTSCRFLPSCSCYAIEAFEKHGVRHGFRLTLKRLLKCHPFSRQTCQGLYDPVPLKID